MNSLTAGVLALALFAAPNTERADCGNAADRYTAAVGRIVGAMRSYAACVAASAKRDDCAAEIQALDNAHDDFADAVADAKACD